METTAANYAFLMIPAMLGFAMVFFAPIFMKGREDARPPRSDRDRPQLPGRGTRAQLH